MGTLASIFHKSKVLAPGNDTIGMKNVKCLKLPFAFKSHKSLNKVDYPLHPTKNKHLTCHLL